MNIADPIADYASRQSNAVAVVDGDRTFTYRELDRLVDAAAHKLRGLGVGPGVRLAIALKDKAELLIALFGAARAGASAFVLDWRSTAAEKTARATAFGAALVIVEPDSSELAGVAAIAFDASWRNAEGDRFVPVRDWNAPFLLCVSSGTTGEPKAVSLTHGQAYLRCLQFWIGVNGRRRHRYFSAMPLCFAGSFWECFTQLIAGNTVILFPPLFAAKEYVKAVEQHRPTHGFLVPTVLRWLLALPGGSGPLLPQFETLVGGGAPLAPDEKREIVRRISPNFIELYGNSATGPISTIGPLDIPARAESVGRPLSAIAVEIVDEQDRAVPAETDGYLRCSGPAVSTGFVNAEASATDGEKFRDGWCYTGEYGCFDEDGFLYLKGRVSSVIIRGGANVYPEEVEAVLRSHPDVAEVVVLGRPSPDLGEEVAAFVVRRGTVSAADLIAHCRGRLSPYKLPQHVEFVASLPQTAAGKVSRRALIERMAR